MGFEQERCRGLERRKLEVIYMWKRRKMENFEALVVPRDRVEKSCSRLLYMGKSLSNQSTYLLLPLLQLQALILLALCSASRTMT